MVTAFQMGELVNYIRSFDEVPDHIIAICNQLEAEHSAPPPKEKKKRTTHEWSSEQRAAAGERLRARQAAKKNGHDEVRKAV